jgi:uncharacterized protein YndB with AHSA1/START domain
MPSTALEIATPTDEPVLIWQRTLSAPLSLVFNLLTDPEYLRHWGPSGLDLVVCDVDLRVDGEYRFVHRAPDGQEFAFHGVYREVEPPRRVVQTLVYEGAPDNEAVETMTLEEVDGGTRVVGHSTYVSIAARDEHVAAGLKEGMADCHERLDEWLASQPIELSDF